MRKAQFDEWNAEVLAAARIAAEAPPLGPLFWIPESDIVQAYCGSRGTRLIREAVSERLFDLEKWGIVRCWPLESGRRWRILEG